MKASYNWLKEFVDFDLSPRELGHRLTMAGLEVEAIEQFEGDTILDIGITPNRPDCLSIRGIARELSAVLENPLKDTPLTIENEEGAGPVVEIESPELCPRYSSRVISGVRPGPSPEWLARRLESCGIRPTSNIVDVTNYVMLEWGQPMHAFDLDRLANGKIVVKQAGDISTFTTLDGEERKISKDMLLIWDGEKPVAIAGVMGGQNTEVSESTVNILLESACFNPSSVRRTSKALGLSTEASYRFERGIDITGTAGALDRAAQMIADLAGGRVSAMADPYPVPYRPKKISVLPGKITSVIGIDIKRSFIEKILTGLAFEVETVGEILEVTPPGFRNDVERDIDIAEEVARIYGYDKIPSTLPAMQMSAPPEHRKQELIKAIKTRMIYSGFSEAINYSFMNPDVLDQLRLPPEDKRRKLIYVKNPLRKEDSAMRTTLIPALLQNISMNVNRGERMVRLFEVASVFLPGDNELPDEITGMAAAFYNAAASSLWQSRHEGFYDVKGALENMLGTLNIGNVSFVKDKENLEPFLHPGKSAAIYIQSKRAGYVGMLHPEAAGAFDIKGDLTIAGLYDVGALLNHVSAEKIFSALPRFPYVERDAALVVKDSVTVSDVRRAILSRESVIIESVELFDIYKGKSIPKDKKSLAFSIRYRSPERTLTDSEVDELHTAIIDRLRKNLDAELRS